MNEVLAVFVYCVPDEEWRSFFCFLEIMRRLEKNFASGGEKLGSIGNAIVKYNDLLKKTDSKLF